MEEEAKGDYFQTPPQYENRMTRNDNSNGAKRYFVIISSIVVIGLIIFGATRFFGGATESTGQTPTPTVEAFPTDAPTQISNTPIPTESEKPTDTPTPTKSVTPTKANSIDPTTKLDRADLDIHVLNGSGVSGASKKMSDYLEGLGYNVIQIGNAENFDYEETEIQLKSASSKYLNLIKSDLGKEYTVGTATTDLATSERPDAYVIVGKE